MTTKSLSPTSTSTAASNNTTTSSGAHKRRRRNANDDGSHLPPPAVESPPPPLPPTPAVPAQKPSPPSGSSSFRNVSACNRCRLRKNRCDQRLPACMSCEKAGVKCVGYDPITKREIPRSYVHYLETRLAYLEKLLTSNDIPFSPAESFPDLAPAPPPPPPATSSFPPPPPPRGSSPLQQLHPAIDPSLSNEPPAGDPKVKREPHAHAEVENLVSDIGLVSFAGTNDPRYLGSSSGLSFARVVFQAVKSSASGVSSGENGMGAGGAAYQPNNRRFRPRIGSSTRIKGARGLGIGGPKEETCTPPPPPAQDSDEDTQMGGSFFGLHSKPTITPAPFPSRTLAERLVNLYFEYANPQIPILHRGEFAGVIDKIYANEDNFTGSVQPGGLGGGHKERYLLNIVCAIGAGIFLSGPDDREDGEEDDDEELEDEGEGGAPYSPKLKAESGRKPKRNSRQFEPESYHATAMIHLEAFLSQSKGGLEELQAVLLLAGYALLRPVSPGLWYIVGVAVRLAVDLGLHHEDAEALAKKSAKKDGKRGKREWSRELRRRLWWCVYSLDRLVSTCVGRPFGIADEVVSTQFPSLLDDQYIHPTAGVTRPPPDRELPSYKVISHHYFRLRLLQSEILQVLQKQSNSLAFTTDSSNPSAEPPIPPKPKGEEYPPHHPYHLQTPFLLNFSTVQCWHKDVDRRLKEWIDTAPQSKEETGVSFSLEFLELNYWQAKIMLYRPCLSVPVILAGELGNSGTSARGRVAERGLGGAKVSPEEEERIYMTVAEAGSKVLRLYRQLHRVHQVNYTFLATHHLFMAGISFLYAIWHSPRVRSRLSMDEVDFTILAATSVLGDLVDKCPPAEACRDAFERMSRATVQMCLSGGHGPMSAISPSGSFMHYNTSSVAGVSGMQSTQGIPTIKERDEDDDDDDDDEDGGGIEEIAPGFTKDFQSMTRTFTGGQDGYVPPPPTPITAQHPQQQQQEPTAHRRRQPHFDEGFQELFTSANARFPPPQHYQPQYNLSPTNPFQTQPSHSHSLSFQSPIPPSLQQHFSSPPVVDRDGMSIDPQLAQPVDWGNLDMSAFGLGGLDWEGDAWSDSGSAGGVGGSGGAGGQGGMDLFDGFFFGSAGS